MGIEPRTSRFQIRQTLYRVAIKASSYSKQYKFSLYRTLLHTLTPIEKFFDEFPHATTSEGRLTHMKNPQPHWGLNPRPPGSKSSSIARQYKFSFYRTLLQITLTPNGSGSVKGELILPC
ncbi:hypothetical protein DPMN_072086 [Dreissena polymorpha]|uniref:Uncharacterized protein n=1 Tax=Dreissena polymorpha TaxID=45954 RepID=A0A9D3Z7P8_DREPO|nr:hypothetical protein DPMN_072086 [Dreissena polymorpha]